MDIHYKIVSEKKRNTYFALILAIFLYGCFGILDRYIFPIVADRILPIRVLFIVIAVMAIMVMRSYHNFYTRNSQTVLSLVIITATIGIILMTYFVSPYPHGDLYYAGLMLVVPYTFIFLPIRFYLGVFLSLFLLVSFTEVSFAIIVSNNFFLIALILICSVSCFNNEKLILQKYQQESFIIQQRNEIDIQRRRADDLLHQILPDPIAERMLNGSKHIADNYADVSVLFADLSGFTEYSTTVSPRQLVKVLNRVFSSFDDIAESEHVEKVKTIGDCYMAVCGLPNEVDDHPEKMIRMAIKMIETVNDISNEIPEFDMGVRIGINTGACIAGVIGRKRFLYDIWGDTVNLASRMESGGIIGGVQVSESTYLRAKHKFTFSFRGELPVKGRGKIKAYVLNTMP